MTRPDRPCTPDAAGNPGAWLPIFPGMASFRDAAGPGGECERLWARVLGVLHALQVGRSRSSSTEYRYPSASARSLVLLV